MKSIIGVSLLTLTGLYGLLVAFILLIGILLGANLGPLLLIAIIVLLLQFLLSPFFTDLTMKWFYKAKFDNQLPDYLNTFVKDLCNKHNMKFPKFGYINDGSPNAFTYGRTKNDARIVLTRGIFELLSEEEVKSVVAHEMGHIIHYDMAFMTAVQLIPLVLYYIYEFCTSSKSKESKNDKKSNLAIVGLIAYVLYIVSQYMILWLSRTREYFADSFSIETTQNPNSLAQALVKIGYGLTLNTTKDGKMSASKSNSLGIFDAKAAKTLVVTSGNGAISRDTIKNAMKWEMWNQWAKWYELNSTHPLISKRLLAISKRSKDFNQVPFVEFDLQPQENYNKHFVKELFILFSPFLVAILWILLVLIDVTPIVSMFMPALIIVCFMIRFSFAHKNKGYKEMKISELLSEVKVSGVTSVPCIIEGTVIGRGTPGYVFDEDFVLKDETGFIFVDKKHVVGLADFFSGLFKTKQLFDKKIRVKGWYRRSPVPYVEIYEYQVENEKPKKMKTYIVTKVGYYILLVLSLMFAITLI